MQHRHRRISRTHSRLDSAASRLDFLGAVVIAVWPAFVARRAPPPLILSSYGRAVVTAVFMALLGSLVIETQGGSDLGLAERLFLSIATCGPLIVAVALRQTTGDLSG